MQCSYIYLASHANENFGNVPEELFINELYNAERHLALAFNRKKKEPAFQISFIYLCLPGYQPLLSLTCYKA